MIETVRPSAVLCAALIAAFAGILASAEEAPPPPAEKPAVVEEKAVEEPAEDPQSVVPAAIEAAGTSGEKNAKSVEVPAYPAPQPKKAEVPVPNPVPNKEKGLAPGVKPLVEIADAYQAAADGIRRWANEESDAFAAADESVKKLQDHIQDNEAAMTKLKFENTKESRARMKDLAKDNKQLWRDLNAAKAERASLSRSLSKTAVQKVREYGDQVKRTLAEVQAWLQ